MFEGIPVDKLTSPVLLGIAILMVLFGVLVPRWTYRAKAKEAETWKEAFFTERESRIELQGQLAEVLEVAKTSKNVLVAMFGEFTEHGKRTGGNRWESGGRIRKPRKKRKTLLQLLGVP